VSATAKKWLFLVPLVAAAAVVVVLNRQTEPPQQRTEDRPARVVRVIEVPRVTVVPRALGYGRVRPERVWEAVAEVNGRVIETHPRLRRGALLVRDALLLRIDPTEFELKVSQVQADILSARAQLAEMTAREANVRASLEIEQQGLELREAELDRKQRLSDRGTVSESELEQEKRALLAQRQAVQAQQNALNLLPAEQELLQAQLARYEAQLADARLDLARTEVRLPFRARISEANVETAQYVREGELLVRADAIDKAEVEAQIPVARMRALLRDAEPMDFSIGETANIAARLGIGAQVTLRDPAGDVTWDARFARLSDTLDPETRTVGVIVVVDDPYADVIPGRRPPLVKGLFVEVELRGAPRPGQIVIPRTALHDGQVYLIEDGQLVIRDVTVAMLQPEYAVIGAGLEAGEQLVVSDLFPAIAGMPLSGEPDPGMLRRLIASAKALPEKVIEVPRDADDSPLVIPERPTSGASGPEPR
jgi:RND family efflux transporter MFP subunit